MPKSLREHLDSLAPERRARIEERAQRLIAEERSLRELREARKRSQREIADRLGVNQAAVSKLERRADMYVSSLRDYVRALGGELEVVARFPDRPPVIITQFHTLASERTAD